MRKHRVTLVGLAALLGVSACAASESNGGGGSGSGGRDAATGGSGGSGGGPGGSSGSGGQGQSATGGTTGGSGGADAAVAPLDAPGDGPGEGAGDAATGEVISGTPDGGPYSRTGWTAQSMPPFATGTKALNMDLKYANAFDGNFNTRWSIGSTNSPSQTIGDQFTFDMVTPHVFTRVLFWAGGEKGVNGPDPRDYPGALDLATSNDCVTFGPAIASGNEPQPGCNACSMPFVITLPAPATARCVRLTLTKRLQLGGAIWWAISELFVYP
ncbi:MAG TPA: discoidin domain-containing protein [Polyangia bacterium]|nr:discoidin domain-containing protein [Polyangia bacterium]